MSENQPGFEKDNAATRMAAYARSLNLEGGRAIARQSGVPSARVIPASMAMPLSVEEVEMRDSAAKAIGILPPDEGGELPPIPRIEDFEQISQMTPGLRSGVGPPARIVEKGSRLIDFKQIQGIDLIRGIVWVDGFEIKIPTDDIVKFKKYALDLAVSFVTEQLALAMAELMPAKEELSAPDTHTSGETLPEMQGNPTID